MFERKLEKSGLEKIKVELEKTLGKKLEYEKNEILEFFGDWVLRDEKGVSIIIKAVKGEKLTVEYTLESDYIEYVINRYALKEKEDIMLVRENSIKFDDNLYLEDIFIKYEVLQGKIKENGKIWGGKSYEKEMIIEMKINSNDEAKVIKKYEQSNADEAVKVSQEEGAELEFYIKGDKYIEKRTGKELFGYLGGIPILKDR